MRPGLIGAGLCVLGGLCMLAAALAFDLDSTEAKALMAAAAVLFVPGALVTYVWMRTRIPPQ